MEPSRYPILPKYSIDILTSSHISIEWAQIVANEIRQHRKKYGIWLPYSIAEHYPDIIKCPLENGLTCSYCYRSFGHIPTMIHNMLISNRFTYDPIALVTAAISVSDEQFNEIMNKYNEQRIKHDPIEVPNLIYVLFLLNMDKRANMVAYRTTCTDFATICRQFPQLFSVLIRHDKEFNVNWRDVFQVLNIMTNAGAEAEIEMYVSLLYDPYEIENMEEILSYLPPELRFTNSYYMEKL